MSAKESSVVSIVGWLNDAARSSEKLKRYKDAARFWNSLLRRLTFESSLTHIDVTRLAAIHYRLGLAHRALNDDRKSLYHLKYSTRLNSSEPRYFEAFGRAFLSGGHWRVAKAQFEKAIKLDPKNVTYLRQTAWVLLMMGRKSEALNYARRAYELNPTRESCLALVRVQMEMDHILQALRLLRTLKRTKRVSQLMEECFEKLDLTFEGAVLKCLRKGIVCDGHPFSLWHLRRAEEFWIDFCSNRDSVTTGSRGLPNVWAAAVACYVLYSSSSKEFSLDDIAVRFGATTLEIWPRLKDVQLSIGAFSIEAA